MIDLTTIPDLLDCIAEALCLFEIWFPPGFFDIMSHLPVHLVEELYWCRPVHAHWCYSIERYMDLLMNYVCERSKPKAGMASGYNVKEAFGFCTKYFKLYPHSKRQLKDDEEELRDVGELPQGACKTITLTRHDMEQIHHYIITNSMDTAELYK